MNSKIKPSRGLIRRWKALRIATKLGFAFGLLLLILLTQTVIAYAALTIVWEANNSIQSGVEIQRLVTGVSRNWETARRLRNVFVFQTPIIGTEQAYELYALPASGKIAEVVRDGATLKLLMSTAKGYENLQEHESHLSKVLSTVSQYATFFEETTNLEFQLNSTKTGLLSQLEHKASDEMLILQANSQCPDLLTTYYQMRFFEKNYQVTRNASSAAQVFEAAAHLHQLIEDCPMQAGQKESALISLNDYEILSSEIFDKESQLYKKLEQLDTLGKSIEPDLIELLVAIDIEVRNANQQIAQTRQVATVMLAAAFIIGLLTTGIIAVIFHKSITQKIINLTRVASQFQQGNLDVRAQVDSADELGDLTGTFNEMAGALVHRLAEIEELHKTLREQAIRDSLTGLYNRRYLDETLPRELANASRDGTHVSLVMMDIDRFKEVNDKYGHVVGDKILAGFGNLLRVRSRAGDVSCRYGGDEFVVVFVGCQLNEALHSAEDWKQRFSDIAISANGLIVRTTISIGVVEWTPGETPLEVLIRADAALYRAKNTGRNRISTQA